MIYGLPGTKYSTAINTTIDNASYTDNTTTLKFGFSATGSLGVGSQAASSANMVPTILVGLYGFDTKDYLFGPHESYPSTYPDNALKGRRFLEFSTATPAPASNSAYITVTKSGSAWNVTANLSAWKPWIDNGSVRRVEVAVIPTLKNADNVVVALDAPSRTFNLKSKAGGQFEPLFSGNSIVKVAAGKAADGNVSGCNNCHDALATTFHTPDRGGNVVVCRLCHITKAAGSHLELQSRSIDSYAHAIHRFQDFDTGSIDFTDPVEAMEYDTPCRVQFPHVRNRGLPGVPQCREVQCAGSVHVDAWCAFEYRFCHREKHR